MIKIRSIEISYIYNIDRLKLYQKLKFLYNFTLKIECNLRTSISSILILNFKIFYNLFDEILAFLLIEFCFYQTIFKYVLIIFDNIIYNVLNMQSDKNNLTLKILDTISYYIFIENN